MSTAATVTGGLRSRRVERPLTGQATQDGTGLPLVRVFGRDLQQRLDPFLMLDHFAAEPADGPAPGFPAHPHRGFEAVTYLVEGRLRHRDSAGHTSVLGPGGVQWMTAGRGIVHSEQPDPEAGRVEGFQLWLNLPARDKRAPAWYRDLPAAALPEHQAPGVTVRVIAGQAVGVAGAVQREATQPLCLDLHLAPGARFEQPLPPGHNGAVYPYRGTVAVGPADGHAAAVPARHLGLLAPADDGENGVHLHNPGPEPARLLLIAGQPLHEPIARYGPFVMNTAAEIHEAVADFRAGRLG